MRKFIVLFSVFASVTLLAQLPLAKDEVEAVESVQGPVQNRTVESDSLIDVHTVKICTSSRSYAYHLKECSGLSRCKSEVTSVTKDQARTIGYKPCKICFKK